MFHTAQTATSADIGAFCTINESGEIMAPSEGSITLPVKEAARLFSAWAEMAGIAPAGAQVKKEEITGLIDAARAASEDSGFGHRVSVSDVSALWIGTFTERRWAALRFDAGHTACVELVWSAGTGRPSRHIGAALAWAGLAIF